MKPKLRAEIVRVEYWDCGDSSHRHKTERVAQGCIDDRARIKAFNATKTVWTKDLYAAVLAQHRGGASNAQIARQLSLRQSMIRYAIKRAERLELRQESPP